MPLLDLITRHPSGQTLVQSSTGDWTAARVLDGIDTIRDHVTGARLAVRLTDVGEALHVLAALDGAAERIVLLAGSVSADQLTRIIELTGVDVLVTDDTTAVGAIGGARVVRRLEELHSRPPSSVTETAWVLATSGTSGEPKLVAHTIETLTRTSKRTPVRGGDATWGLLYEWSRFAGLQVLLQAVLSGATLIAPPIEAPLEQQLAQLTAAGCTHLSATPTLWRKIAMTPGADRLPLRQVSLGGEIADDRILGTLASLFPAARVTHIYASTEAGVGFSVNDRRAGFPLSYLTHRAGTPELRVIAGRLHVRNEALRPTYLGTETTFGSEDGWIDTGDAVRVDGDRVHFLGRESGTINVGGNKVHPETVERVLLQHPGVVAARVYGKRNAITGALVVADVVLDHATQDVQTARVVLRRHAAEHLAAHEVPALITVVAEIAANGTGKIARSTV